MKTIKSPGIFLGSLQAMSAVQHMGWHRKWAAEKGYAGVQVPTWASCRSEAKTSGSKDYCDEFARVARQNGVEVDFRPTCRASSMPCIPPMMKLSTVSQYPEYAAIPRRVRLGQSSR